MFTLTFGVRVNLTPNVEIVDIRDAVSIEFAFIRPQNFFLRYYPAELISIGRNPTAWLRLRGAALARGCNGTGADDASSMSSIPCTG